MHRGLAGLATAALLLTSCYDRDRCGPELWGPVGDWRFINMKGVFMTNRLFDGWQQVITPGQNRELVPEYPGLDRPWLFVAGSPASYGLRFSTKTTGACDPGWAGVTIDGVAVKPRVLRRTVVEFSCGSPHFCPEENQTEEVDDVVFDWTPSSPGTSTAELEWGGFKRTLPLVIAGLETAPPLAALPARCWRVQALDERTWLCDRAVYRDGEQTHAWPEESLVQSLGGGHVLEWGDSLARLWHVDAGLATLVDELDAGVSPGLHWDGRYSVPVMGRDDIFVLKDGTVVLDAKDGLLRIEHVLSGQPAVSWTSLTATLGTVRGELVSIHPTDDPFTNRVCLGLGEPAAACHSVWGLPRAIGDDAVWFTNGNNFVRALWFPEGPMAFANSELLLAEDKSRAERSRLDLVRSSDGGQKLLGTARSVVADTKQGGCLFYDLHADGGLVPRVYPELGPLAEPLLSWDHPYTTQGDGEGDLRWCTKVQGTVTYVYRAPTRP